LMETDGTITSKRVENGMMFLSVDGQEYKVNNSESIYYDVLDTGKKVRITVEDGTIVRLRPQPIKPPVVTAAEIKKDQQQQAQKTAPAAPAQKPAPAAPAQGKVDAPSPIPSIMDGIRPPSGRPLTIPDIELLRIAADVVLASDKAPVTGDVVDVIRERTLRIWQVAGWLKAWVTIEVRM